MTYEEIMIPTGIMNVSSVTFLKMCWAESTLESPMFDAIRVKTSMAHQDQTMRDMH